MRAQTVGLLRLALGLAISAVLGLIVGRFTYFAIQYFFPNATWTRLAWGLGILVALGGASAYVDAFIAARRQAEAIIQHLKDQAERKP